jgi:hypothetical protein
MKVSRVVEVLVLLLLQRCLLVHGFFANQRRYRYITIPVWDDYRWAIATRSSRSIAVVAAMADPTPKDMEVASSASSVWGGHIPTLEQLKNDPFIDQVRHAEFLVGLLDEDAGRQTDVVLRRLRAQLSHPNGRRGFLVTFLTINYNDNDNDDDDDETTIPPSLVTVLVEQMMHEWEMEDDHASPVVTTASPGSTTKRSDSSSSSSTLVLLYMNIVMPTAMKTLHTDQELSLQSARTATTATRLLQAVSERLKAQTKDSFHIIQQQSGAAVALELERHGRAIWTVASATTTTDTTKESLPSVERESFTDDLEEYWDDFLDRWGYAAQQRADIAQAMESLWPSV